MKSREKSKSKATQIPLKGNKTYKSVNQQNTKHHAINTPKHDSFTILLRGSFILVFLAFLFVATIYYGIINP